MHFRSGVYVIAAFLLVAAAWPQAKRPPMRQVNPPDSDPQYFPRGIFSQYPDLSDWIARWYATELRALEEPSLFEQAKDNSVETYRLLLVPSFRHRLAVRLELQPNGTGLLTAKMTTGADWNPGHVLRMERISISTEQIEGFRTLLTNARFWSLPTEDRGITGFDGTEWVMEGRRHGTHKVVDRWSGFIDEKYLQLCQYLIELSPIKPEEPPRRKKSAESRYEQERDSSLRLPAQAGSE